jgi:hypothetical protein
MNDAPDLFDSEGLSDYPLSPGHRGVETSVAAADAIAPHLGRLQQLTLATIAEAARPWLYSE